MDQNWKNKRKLTTIIQIIQKAKSLIRQYTRITKKNTIVFTIKNHLKYHWIQVYNLIKKLKFYLQQFTDNQELRPETIQETIQELI